MPSEDLFLRNELKGKIYFLPVLRVSGNKSGDESAPLRPLVVWPPPICGTWLYNRQSKHSKYRFSAQEKHKLGFVYFSGQRHTIWGVK